VPFFVQASIVRFGRRLTFVPKRPQMLLYLRIMRCPDARQWHFSSVLKVALICLCLTASTWLHAQTISGTVQDPSGAFIPGARIEINGVDLV